MVDTDVFGLEAGTVHVPEDVWRHHQQVASGLSVVETAAEIVSLRELLLVHQHSRALPTPARGLLSLLVAVEARMGRQNVRKVLAGTFWS